MNKFELYHPILTEHYSLDWLTQSKVKDVFALRNDPVVAKAAGRKIDVSIEATTDYVNDVMHLIMSNQELTWGITDKAQHEFRGLFSIFNITNSSAEIKFEILSKDHRTGIMTEVLTRMIHFVFEELELSTINATVPVENHTAEHLLTKFNFQKVNGTTFNLKA